MGGKFGVHIGGKGVIGFPYARPDAPAKQKSKEYEQAGSIEPTQLAIKQKPGGRQGDQCQNRQLLAHDLRVHGDGRNHSGDAQNQSDVGNVGAIGVTQRQPRISLGCRQS